MNAEMETAAPTAWEPTKTKPSPLLANGILAFLGSSLFNGFLVIIKELINEVKQGMAGVFGHHWIGHGVLVFGVFLLLFGVLSLLRANVLLKVGNACCLRDITMGIVFGTGLIAGFYVSLVIKA